MRATTCDHNYLLTWTHTYSKCCCSKWGWTVEILIGWYDSWDVFFVILTCLFQYDEMVKHSPHCFVFCDTCKWVLNIFVVLYGHILQDMLGKIWFPRQPDSQFQPGATMQTMGWFCLASPQRSLLIAEVKPSESEQLFFFFFLLMLTKIPF